MSSVAPCPADVQPTNLAPLADLLAYPENLGLARHLARRKRGLTTLALSVVWLVLAWRGSGRPHHLGLLAEPLLVALLGRERLPTAQTLHRSLAYFAAHDVRAALEAAYRAELPRRTGRIWAALDAHQLPYWGRKATERLRRGWSGKHNRSLRGYRLYLAVDTDTGQVITFLLLRGDARDHRLTVLLARRLRQLLGPRLAGIVADSGFTSHAAVAGLLRARIPFILGFRRTARIRARLAALSGQQQRWLTALGAVRLGLCAWDPRLQLVALRARQPTDERGPWVYVTSVQRLGPARLAALYRQRWRVEQVIDDLTHGHDLDHLVATRLPPNRVAVGFRLLARTLAIGYQIQQANGRPPVIREPLAFRATHVEGLGVFYRQADVLVLFPLHPRPAHTWTLSWPQPRLRLVA